MSLRSLQSTLILAQQRRGLEEAAARELQAALPSEQGGEDSTGWERLAQGSQLVKAENQVETLDQGCDFCLQGKEMGTGFLSSLLLSEVW